MIVVHSIIDTGGPESLYLFIVLTESAGKMPFMEDRNVKRKRYLSL